MTENKLPAEFKAKWIQALRSGEYKQGEGYLYNKLNNSFCCLGVAAHLCGVPLEYIESKPHIGDIVGGHLSVSDAPNFPSILVYSSGETVCKTLAEMNDTDRMSFSEIANYIEANL